MHFFKRIFLILTLILVSCSASDDENRDTNTYAQLLEACAGEADFPEPEVIANEIAEQFNREAIKSEELSEEMGFDIFIIEVPNNMPIETIKPFFGLWELSNDEVVLQDDWGYDEYSDGYDANYVYKNFCDNDINVSVGLISVGFTPSISEVEIWIKELGVL